MFIYLDDDSRVVLTPIANFEHDYINASFIDVSNSSELKVDIIAIRFITEMLIMLIILLIRIFHHYSIW